MKIETKFNPGDMAWYMKNDILHSAPIRALQVRAAEKDFKPTGSNENFIDQFCDSQCTIYYFTCHGQFPENRMYGSREELGAAIVDGTYVQLTNDVSVKQ